MAKGSNPVQGLKIEKPKSVFERTFQVDYKSLFKSASKGIIHAAARGNLEEAAIDATEIISSLGLKADDPSELAFLLIIRSMTEALSALVRETSPQRLIDEKGDLDAILKQLDFSGAAGGRGFH
jgi:hypothetical protein